MLVEYLFYALIGLVVALPLLVLHIRSERARGEAEAKMTPEQREAERREREAFRRME
jgi:hypothetical protein